jgi:hypothetical protein
MPPGRLRSPDEEQDAKQGVKGEAMAKNTICLWYDKDAEAAARFYVETFPDSAVGAVQRAPSDYPSGKQGDVLTVEFTVAGVSCLGKAAAELHCDASTSGLAGTLPSGLRPSGSGA